MKTSDSLDEICGHHMSLAEVLGLGNSNSINSHDPPALFLGGMRRVGLHPSHPFVMQLRSS
jgi:hypothetical protein